MTPFQQLYLGMGVKKKTYMEDVFSTYLLNGTGSNITVNNGIDLAGKGGMVWYRRRDAAESINVEDTVRGVDNVIYTNSSNQQADPGAYGLQGFSSTGFTYGLNTSGGKYTSWTFRKAKGFFDVVTWTGNGTAGRVISHSLGSVPGLIMIKSTTDATSWFTYHKSIDASSYVMLNENNAVATSQSWFMNDTAPTSTGFSLGSSSNVNGSGRSYVAYVFAGGESTAATARSVDFDGTGDVLSVAASDDFHCTGDVTIECWVKPDGYGTYDAIWGHGMYTGTNGVLFYTVSGELRFYKGGGDKLTLPLPELGQWTHIAMVRSGSKVSVYMNGTEEGSYTDTADFGASNNKTFHVGSGYNDSNGGTNVDFWNGKISNFRFIKGTALYTSSFRPSTEPLENVTNTKLLCCNNSSTTGSTVTPGTITANGNPTASTDSPFDDPAAFTFGDSKEGIIKCGSYIGNGNDDGPEINLGWEPQWLMVKRTDSADNWPIYDSMRGIITGGNDTRLYGNKTDSEYTSTGYLKLTPTGFKSTKSSGQFNNNGGTYIYICIRRADGYVGKPPELGTDVLAMDAGNSTSTESWTSGFPVDYAIYKRFAHDANWYSSARLIQGKELTQNTTAAESAWTGAYFDSNTAWGANSGMDTSYQSWMWKRHAGFDVVTYTGNGTVKRIPHSMNKVPEMIWVKRRDASANWMVYHKGLNSGTNPEQKYLEVNDTAAEADATGPWDDTAPTATAFTVGASSGTNGSTDKYIATLFASVDGISKVGSYDGSSSSQTITTGFQPRFVLIKRIDGGSYPWVLLDTTRGWGSGNDQWLQLNDSSEQGAHDMGAPTSTGFTLTGGSGQTTYVNENTNKYIYYAHA